MQHFKSLEYLSRTYFFKYTTLQEMLKAYIFFFNTALHPWIIKVILSGWEW